MMAAFVIPLAESLLKPHALVGIVGGAGPWAAGVAWAGFAFLLTIFHSEPVGVLFAAVA